MQHYQSSQLLPTALEIKLLFHNMISSEIHTEQQALEADIAAVKEWWAQPRWRHTKRTYTAEEICMKRGNLKIDYPSSIMARKFWEIVENRWKVCVLESKLFM